MADRMNLPHITYRSYESGRSMPPLSFYERLLSAQIDAFYVTTGRSIVDDASASTRNRKKNELANRPSTVEDATNLIKKLIQQARNEEADQQRLRGKAG